MNAIINAICVVVDFGSIEKYHRINTARIYLQIMPKSATLVQIGSMSEYM